MYFYLNNFLVVPNLKMALTKKHFITYFSKLFVWDTPQGIKRQNNGPKEHNGNIYPAVDRNRQIRKTEACDRHIFIFYCRTVL